MCLVVMLLETRLAVGSDGRGNRYQLGNGGREDAYRRRWLR